MDWCERCGRYFVRKTGLPVNHGVRGRGPVVEAAESVCSDCLRHGEWIDEYGQVRTGPREETVIDYG